MASRSLGLVVLFLRLQAAVNESEIICILGSNVDLECHYAGETSLDKLRVLWQTKQPDPCLVGAYFPNKPEKNNLCEEFRNRTQINKENFSLKLLHVSIKDERTYECIVQRNKTKQFKVEHTTTVTLKVAAYYRKPTIRKLNQSGDEMTFMCNSSSGYPEHKLRWTHQMNSSPFNITDCTATLQPDGTFSVCSILTVKPASNIKLECTIENERLHQNSTTTYEEETNSPGNSDNRTAPNESPHHRPVILSTLVVILILPVILYICWGKTSCPGRAYAAAAETENPLVSGTVGEQQ